MRVIWLWHLSCHWSPGLIRLIWLARRVAPSSVTALCAFIPKLCAQWKRMTFPERGGSFFGQEHMSSWAPLLDLPNKLSRSICRGMRGGETPETPDTSKWGAACGSLPFFRKTKQDKMKQNTKSRGVGAAQSSHGSRASLNSSQAQIVRAPYSKEGNAACWGPSSAPGSVFLIRCSLWLLPLPSGLSFSKRNSLCLQLSSSLNLLPACRACIHFELSLPLLVQADTKLSHLATQWEFSESDWVHLMPLKSHT